ncbi:MAG TPA: hypothetical protein VHM19_08780 [Polyangiales bacterium]|nr:hypothetical protein [Polyangiales bacterium]
MFFSQEAVDVWLADGRVSLEGEVLQVLPDGPSFKLVTAVHVKDEVAGGGDAPQLTGKVKSTEAIVELSGEVAGGSVVLGDNAYEAVDGFLGELVDPSQAHDALKKLAAVLRTKEG